MRCPTRLPFLPVFQQTWNRFFGIYMPPLKGCWRKFRSQIGYYVAWPYIHLTLYRPSLGYLEVLRYHTCPILMVRPLLLPSALSFHLSFHQGHKLPSSIAHPSTKHATCCFSLCDNFVKPLMFLVSRFSPLLFSPITPRITLVLSFPTLPFLSAALLDSDARSRFVFSFLRTHGSSSYGSTCRLDCSAPSPGRIQSPCIPSPTPPEPAS